ncbi:beta-N-acetylhexosaminidase [Rufibacter roseus]|uniref:beta-N-acetylhexosaminidase n=1 Tax=Rufibacter roseus TaxID=1567108 RepID=A0ABW2DHE9_9BACT|nr:family 20 glycosylhydrolase [Rufibacter roseus]
MVKGLLHKKGLGAWAIMILCWAMGCSSSTQVLQDDAWVGNALKLIPQPRQMQQGKGTFLLNAQTCIHIEKESSAEVLNTAQFLAQALQEATSLGLEVKQQEATPANTILLKINPLLAVGSEGYVLSVQPTGVVAEAISPQGLFWAVQTLRQMVLLQSADFQNGQLTNIKLPVVEIQDAPSFGWRGLMLDVSRHFLSKEILKRYIDHISFYKLNTLHLHLSDDQGWRLEIPAYPNLTTVGAWRKEPDGSRHGGYYTASDIQELVAYAQVRQVTLIPEIDVPGHTQAILAAYPELSCTGGPFAVSNKAGVHPDILCAGNEKTYTFLSDVFAEVAALFPGQYLHIGGDEAPKQRWKTCAKCQQLMKRQGLANEEELQGYFTQRIVNLLQQNRKKAVAWDEVMQGGVDTGAVIQAWHGVDAVKEAVEKGAKVVVSPRSSFYFDLNSGITTTEKVYATPVVPTSLPEAGTKLVLGAEAALWTEETPENKVDAMVFPRLLAFAENVWTESHGRPYPEFQSRLQTHYGYLEKWGVRYGFEEMPVKVKPSYVVDSNQFEVMLQPSLPNVQLHYTLDGTVPTLHAPVYTGKPIQFSSSATLKVVPFKGQQPWHAPVEAVFVRHQALHKKSELENPYHASYSGGGALALTDGILGDEDYRKGFWQGFEKEDLEVVIDLGQEEMVKEVATRFLQDANSWIFLPTLVELWVAGESKEFKRMSVATHQVPMLQEKAVVKAFSLKGGNDKVRYIKVKAKNVGVCPPGHPGAGGAAFLMADEIIVK